MQENRFMFREALVVVCSALAMTLASPGIVDAQQMPDNVPQPVWFQP